MNIDPDLVSKIFPNPPKKRLYELSDILLENTDKKYILGDGTWKSLLNHKKRHQAKGNGFGYSIINKPFKNKVTRTLSARYHKDGGEILIEMSKGQKPRRLTPLECLRIQGFPKKFEKYFNGKKDQPVSDTQAYKQFGNAVAVPLISAFAKNIKKII